MGNLMGQPDGTEENIRTYFDEHEWININRQKTGVVSNIRLLDIANRIIGTSTMVNI